jgi:tripartite-type tricarboxylate transporter receptor subunit TctC
MRSEIKMNRRALLMAIVAAGCAWSGPATAQNYPNKPIKIVVAFAPGGPADVMARLIAARMPAVLGQSVFIENKPGAGGTIGARYVADSDPDGYTLLLGNTSTLVVAPLLYKNVGYDPAKAFAPIANLGTTSNVMITNLKFGMKSVQDVIAYARKNPGKLNFSSAGIGTPPHLIGEMFKQKLGLDIIHVPYKGGGPSIQAVMTGETQFSFENPAASLPFVRAGSVRGLAVTSAARSPQTPELPTMIEAGVPDFVSISFTGVVATAATPPAIVNKLNEAINASLQNDDVKKALTTLAVEPQIGPPDAFGKFLTEERAKWSEVVKAAHLLASQ